MAFAMPNGILLASVGETVETTVRHPISEVIRMTLETPEACAYANDLLMQPNSRWRLVPTATAN